MGFPNMNYNTLLSVIMIVVNSKISKCIDVTIRTKYSIVTNFVMKLFLTNISDTIIFSEIWLQLSKYVSG